MCNVFSWIAFGAWLFAMGSAGVLWWRLRRAWRQADADLEEALQLSREVTALHDILFYCACRSFLYQHIPFWRPWSEMTGVGFHIEVRERGKGKQ